MVMTLNHHNYGVPFVSKLGSLGHLVRDFPRIVCGRADITIRLVFNRKSAI